MEPPMMQPKDLSRSRIPFEQDRTVVAVIDMSQSSWLVAAFVPGRDIERVAVAFEAGRDGFWLARWLRLQGIEAHVIPPTSIAVSREHRRAKTDRLDTELLKRAFLGWLRGRTTAPWPLSRPWARRTPSARAASARTW